MVNDINTLNGALSELGETLAANITTKGVSASASDGLTTLAGKILQITGGGGSTTIFEDKGVTGDYNSDYTDLQTGITTTVGTTGTKVQASGSGDKFRKANALISGDFEIKYTCIEATVVYGAMRFMNSSNANIFTVEQYVENSVGINIQGGTNTSYPIGETISFPFTMTIQRENGKLSVWYNDIQVASNLTCGTGDGYFAWKLYGNDGRYQIFKDLLITDLSTPYNPCTEYQEQIANAITYINGSGS